MMESLLLALSPGLFHWLTLSSLLFSIGIYGLLTRRDMVGLLIALELMINAAALNFIIFNHFVAPGSLDGQIMAIFIIAVAAAEVVVAMAILVGLYKHFRTTDVTTFTTLKEPEGAALGADFPGALVSPAAHRTGGHPEERSEGPPSPHCSDGGPSSLRSSG